MNLQDTIRVVTIPTGAERAAAIEKERERERAEVLDMLDVMERCIRHGWDPTRHGGHWDWFTDECPMGDNGFPRDSAWPGKWAPANERKPLDECPNQTWSFAQAELYAIKRTRDSYEPLSMAIDTALHTRVPFEWNATSGSPLWGSRTWEIMPHRTVDDVLRLIEEARQLVKQDKVLSRDELDTIELKADDKWKRMFPDAPRWPKWPWS